MWAPPLDGPSSHQSSRTSLSRSSSSAAVAVEEKDFLDPSGQPPTVSDRTDHADLPRSISPDKLSRAKTSVRFESPREAYQRRKAAAAAQAARERPPLHLFMMTLMGSGRSDSDTESTSTSGLSSPSPDSELGVEEEAGQPVIPSIEHARSPAAAPTPAVTEQTYGPREGASIIKDLPNRPMSESARAVEFSGYGTFTFTEPIQRRNSEEDNFANSRRNSLGSFNKWPVPRWQDEDTTSFPDFARLFNTAVKSPPSSMSHEKSSEDHAMASAQPQSRRASDTAGGKASSEDSVVEIRTIPELEVTAPSSASHQSTSVHMANVTPTLATTLPSEIIQQFYQHLHPRDYNAARHTCRAWMSASLDRSIITEMLKRGAWWSAVERYLREDVRLSNHYQDCRNEIWAMSCLLSRECALAGDWTGNGFIYMNYAALPTCDHHWGNCPKSSCGAARRSMVIAHLFRPVAKVDFTELMSGYPTTLDTAKELIFTASSCGNYLLVAEAGIIYVYELMGGNLKVLTSVICPRKVLAMSIDGSSRTLAVAALLEGRMGFMCNLQEEADDEVPVPHRRSSLTQLYESRKAEQRKVLEHEIDDDTMSLPDLSGRTSRASTRSDRHPASIEIRANEDAEFISSRATSEARSELPNHSMLNAHMAAPNPAPSNGSRNVVPGVPIETGPRSLYHQLCAEDDPPRSVAICPQRQCVAFGCTGGLELHWVDAMTGQDLNRWFPLTGPSDYLHFIPPRRGVDTPRKLRLISSAAHPTQRAITADRFAVPRTVANPSLTNSFLGTIGFDGREPRIAGFVSDCDHFRAIPLNDGFHILFVDPDTGMLCLGSDAPMGDPRRLVRKIMLIPPTKGAVPHVYAASPDMINEPRIVVAYEDQIVIFSIPSDVFLVSRTEQQPGGLTEEELVAASLWLDWWPIDKLPANYIKRGPAAIQDKPGPTAIWPLFVSGNLIGTLNGLTSLAINHASARLSIWGFAKDGHAAIWQIDDGFPNSSITERHVSRNGQVMPAFEVDANGDVIMSDVKSLVSDEHGETQMDGGLSPQTPPGRPGLPRQPRYSSSGSNLSGIWYSEDGDPIMMDVSIQIQTSSASNEMMMW